MDRVSRDAGIPGQYLDARNRSRWQPLNAADGGGIGPPGPGREGDPAVGEGEIAEGEGIGGAQDHGVRHSGIQAFGRSDSQADRSTEIWTMTPSNHSGV